MASVETYFPSFLKINRNPNLSFFPPLFFNTTVYLLQKLLQLQSENSSWEDAVSLAVKSGQREHFYSTIPIFAHCIFKQHDFFEPSDSDLCTNFLFIAPTVTFQSLVFCVFPDHLKEFKKCFPAWRRSGIVNHIPLCN